MSDSPATTATKPKPAPKPRPAAKKGATRRTFLEAMLGSWIGVAWTTLTASLVALLLGTVRYLFPNVLSEPPSTVRAGPVGSYELGVVDETFKDQGIWIVRWMFKGKDVIYALSTTCTHLGCTPNWLSSDEKFKCPCHGSGFYITGINFEGPAPRPLERYAVSKTDDNQVLVDKSKKFQQELGQWDDPDSFIQV